MVQLVVFFRSSFTMFIFTAISPLHCFIIVFDISVSMMMH